MYEFISFLGFLCMSLKFLGFLCMSLKFLGFLCMSLPLVPEFNCTNN